VQAKQNKEFIHYFPSAARCSAIARKAGLHHGYLGRRMPELPTSLPSFFFPQLYMLSVTSYGMGHPFDQLGSAVPAVPPPSSLCTPSLLSGGVE